MPQWRRRTPKETQAAAKCSQKPGRGHHRIDQKSRLRLQGVPGRSWGTPLAPKSDKIHTFSLILKQRLQKNAMVPFFTKASQLGRRRRPTCEHLLQFSMDGPGETCRGPRPYSRLGERPVLPVHRRCIAACSLASACSAAGACFAFDMKRRTFHRVVGSEIARMINAHGGVKAHNL